MQYRSDCAHCHKPLTGKQRRFCGYKCRKDFYIAEVTAEARSRLVTHCKGCGAPLQHPEKLRTKPRQTCDKACRKILDTQQHNSKRNHRYNDMRKCGFSVEYSRSASLHKWEYESLLEAVNF